MERFITTNEDWDISRQVDEDFIHFFLHGTTYIHYDTVKELQSYCAFAGIELRDGCLCIRVLRSAL